MRTDERLFRIEQSLKNAVARDEMHAQLSKKASNGMMDELRESLVKLQEMSA